MGPLGARPGHGHSGAWSTLVAGTRVFQVPKMMVPNTIPDGLVTFFFPFRNPCCPGAHQGSCRASLLLLACCLLPAACLLVTQAPPWLPNHLINQLRYYVLQLGDPNQEWVLGPSGRGFGYLSLVSMWLFFCFPPRISLSAKMALKPRILRFPTPGCAVGQNANSNKVAQFREDTCGPDVFPPQKSA